MAAITIGANLNDGPGHRAAHAAAEARVAFLEGKLGSSNQTTFEPAWVNLTNAPSSTSGVWIAVGNVAHMRVTASWANGAWDPVSTNPQIRPFFRIPNSFYDNVGVPVAGQTMTVAVNRLLSNDPHVGYGEVLVNFRQVNIHIANSVKAKEIFISGALILT